MAVIGKNILDNLTTGMYSDSKVIYREYIQNACDQIDLAIANGLMSSEEASVDIYIDADKRYISIEDNATGVPSADFISNLGDIANSNKQIGKNKGFRGIGRLCGLAYCKYLKFITSYQGESIASEMICDAKKMRSMLYENKKYSIDEIWDTIVTFDKMPEVAEKHYFKVELVDINKENTDLLDDKKVKEYLSFVAPVPYKNTFHHLADKIVKYANDIDYKINEYFIYVDGFQIFKEYSYRLKEFSGGSLKNYDEIKDIDFHNFYNKKGDLIAWSWIGLSRFEKSIPKVNQMRGIRLRSGNIQLGNDDVLKDLFKENRGNYYFVGEVFAVSKELIPNSQRDYFNENETRVEFEDAIRVYFYDVLHKLYTDANKIKNAYKHQEEYIAKVQEFEKKIIENGFVNETEKQKLQYNIEDAKKKAEDSRKQLSKFDGIDISSPIAIVNKRIGEKFQADRLKKKAELTCVKSKGKTEKKNTYITDSLSKLTRSERKLVSKILSIITDNASKDVAEKIINKIKEELK